MTGQDLTHYLQQQVQQALADGNPLQIVGGNSKALFGSQTVLPDRLELGGHTGIIAYQPSESVITVRAGTCLHYIEALLNEHKQMLAFEPPAFGNTATIGGTMACGLSGPRRPFAGSARDFMLGCKLLNGYGELLNFGGQVMKNVAGFDVSRLMVGAYGSLGVLLEISLRVMPKPDFEITLSHAEADAGLALATMNRWAGQPWPLSALAYDVEIIRCRLAGAEAAVRSAAQRLGGAVDEQGEQFWHALREQQLSFFTDNQPLWRISVAPSVAMLDLPGRWLLDWGGALRWLQSPAPAWQIHQTVHHAGGHAYGFKQVNPIDRMQLTPEISALQAKIKHAFDPQAIFNPTLPR